MNSEKSPGRLLCVANYPSNTGYAWDFIEGLYAEAADLLDPLGIETLVAYPRVDEPPVALRGSAARAVELPIRLGRPSSVLRLVRFIRANQVEIVYLADRTCWHPSFALLRWAGVRRIIVHDHTSGERTRPHGLRLWLKRRLRSIDAFMADEVIGVSEFVARRKVEVDLVPAHRVHKVWNTIVLPESQAGSDVGLLEDMGVPPGRPLIMCLGRASVEKGFEHLFRAFDELLAGWSDAATRPRLVYMGDGPDMKRLQGIRAGLAHRDSIHLLGYVPSAARFLGHASFCVFPSVWQEAFGLGALEPMARSRPVIATKVGGLEEVVEDGETGLLIPPRDEQALGEAMGTLLKDDALRERMGRAARLRVETCFDRRDAMRRIAELLTGTPVAVGSHSGASVTGRG